MNEWINRKDRLPGLKVYHIDALRRETRSEPVLVYLNYCSLHIPCVARLIMLLGDPVWRFEPDSPSHNYASLEEVTHWMPLPDAPEKSDDSVKQ